LVVVELDVEVARPGVGAVDEDHLEGIQLIDVVAEIAHVDPVDAEGRPAAQVGGRAVGQQAARVGGRGGGAGGDVGEERREGGGGGAGVDVGEERRDDGDAAVVGVERRGGEQGQGLVEGEVAVVVEEHRVGDDAEEVQGEAHVDRAGRVVVVGRQVVGGELRDVADGGRHRALLQCLQVEADRGAPGGRGGGGGAVTGPRSLPE